MIFVSASVTDSRLDNHTGTSRQDTLTGNTWIVLLLLSEKRPGGRGRDGGGGCGHRLVDYSGSSGFSMERFIARL